MMRHLALLLTLSQFAGLTAAASLSGWNGGASPRGGSSDSSVVALPEERMPSLFTPDESEYDRYAACLAATESLRRARDKALQKDKRAIGNAATEEKKRIQAEYVVNSARVLKAMGVSVSQFNQLGRQVNQDEELKEKVSSNRIV